MGVAGARVGFRGARAWGLVAASEAGRGIGSATESSAPSARLWGK